MTTPQAPTPDRTVTVAAGGEGPGGEIPVQLYLPPSETGVGTSGTGVATAGPGIVLVQEIFGVSRYVRARARDLADLGYVVAVPELYWRIGLTATVEDGDPQAVLGAGMAASAQLGLAPAIADTAAVLAWLPSLPEVRGGVGLVGFCFGGGVAFAVAAAAAPGSLDGLVSYYGSSIPAQLEADPAVADRVTVPSLHHWGAEDAFIPLEVQEKVRHAVGHEGVEWHTYEGANHAFDNPNPVFHDAVASAIAWERTTAFLARVLPVA